MTLRYISHFTFHISHFTFHISHFTFHFSCTEESKSTEESKIKNSLVLVLSFVIVLSFVLSCLCLVLPCLLLFLSCLCLVLPGLGLLCFALSLFCFDSVLSPDLFSTEEYTLMDSEYSIEDALKELRTECDGLLQSIRTYRTDISNMTEEVKELTRIQLQRIVDKGAEEDIKKDEEVARALGVY